jgi:hypothetical protein
MYLSIFGFLADIDEDDSLKFELHLDESLNVELSQLLGHPSLHAMAEGDWLLTSDQVVALSSRLGVILPRDLNLFIGLTA